MLKNLTLLGGSVVIGLLRVELALHLFDAYPPSPYPPEARRSDVSTAHPAHGNALHPTHTVSFAYPPGSPRGPTIRSNSDGFRQVRELAREEDRIHVLVTGNAHAFRHGVEESERFPDRLERLRPGFRVDTVAMSGWGLLPLAIGEAG